jgi:hypothetical protein
MTPSEAKVVCDRALTIVSALTPPVSSEREALRQLFREARETAKSENVPMYRWAFGLLYDSLTWTTTPLDARALDGLTAALTLIGSETYNNYLAGVTEILRKHEMETMHRALADAILATAEEVQDD